MIYVSTSRKPTQKTRSLARWLERLFGGESENRGKRSVSGIAARMSGKGFKRAVFVYERHGNPSTLNFFDSEEGWLYPELEIGEFKVFKSEKARLPPVTRVEAEGARGKEVLKMIGFEEPEVDDGLKLVAGEHSLDFYEGKAKVFSISVKRFNDEPAGGSLGSNGVEK